MKSQIVTSKQAASRLPSPSNCLSSQQPQTWSQATLPRPCRLAYSTVGRWPDSSPAIGPSFLGSSAALGSSRRSKQIRHTANPESVAWTSHAGTSSFTSLGSATLAQNQARQARREKLLLRKTRALPGFRFPPCLRPEPARTDGSQGRPKGPATNKRRSS